MHIIIQCQNFHQPPSKLKACLYYVKNLIRIESRLQPDCFAIGRSCIREAIQSRLKWLMNFYLRFVFILNIACPFEKCFLLTAINVNVFAHFKWVIFSGSFSVGHFQWVCLVSFASLARKSGHPASRPGWDVGH